jgi:hypothetical protein
MCLGIQGRSKGLSIVHLYQGIMGNPSSLSLDALKKASLLKKTRTGVTLIQYEGFSKGVTFT